MISSKASAEDIEAAYRNKAKYYDPDVTGDRSHVQVFEELTLAYKTLINKNSREEYDDYLASVGTNMNRDYEEVDHEEVERRRSVRGK
jgi:DnaJ-class molecular chaperone